MLPDCRARSDRRYQICRLSRADREPRWHLIKIPRTSEQGYLISPARPHSRFMLHCHGFSSLAFFLASLSTRTFTRTFKGHQKPQMPRWIFLGFDHVGFAGLF
ncbi:Protein of unknown function [Pyronema omphalodes CBS 100304]|uniref:Uncharacterized protein n=1 Tax=Pyronema omphalodes (strain CBS 100304) TaxID=1076935 RepID=U4LAW0_PYROM|nr:Protein of unknown function [Pyronema omphalodes CBS 100304]